MILRPACTDYGSRNPMRWTDLMLLMASDAEVPYGFQSDSRKDA